MSSTTSGSGGATTGSVKRGVVPVGPPGSSNEGAQIAPYTTLDDLEMAQTERCMVLQNEPEVICFLLHFDWPPPAHAKQR